MTTTVAPPARVGAAPDVRRARADRAWDVGIVVAVNALVIVGMWFRHGQLDTASGPGGTLTAVGQLTALLGTYALLIELLLMSRIGWLERALGFDRLTVWHRWAGFATVTLLGVHVVATTVGYAREAGVNVVDQTIDFVQHYPDVLMAFVAFALLLAVAASSIRAARRRIDRETWYFVHLYAYLAVALAFAHQLAVGTDFTDDAVARAYWIVLTGAVVSAVLVARVGQPLLFNARHKLRVEAVTPEGHDTVSIRITGRDLGSMDVRPGQFFLWRFLTRDGWWKAHPFSLSAGNNGRTLRITVKALGDTTTQLQSLRRGTRVFAEGPYGTFTTDRITDRESGRGILLIAGGIGITPLRAMLEDLYQGPGSCIVLFRVACEANLVFRDELAKVATTPYVDVHLLVDEEIGDDQTDQLGLPALRRLVPDIVDRVVFVCGPPAMVDVVLRRLQILGVPRRHVHVERFDY